MFYLSAFPYCFWFINLEKMNPEFDTNKKQKQNKNIKKKTKTKTKTKQNKQKNAFNANSKKLLEINMIIITGKCS